jgi:hypothetical protein
MYIQSSKLFHWDFFAYRRACGLRVYRRGYMVFLLMLWSWGDHPLVSIGRARSGAMRHYGKALRVSY